MHKNYLLTGFSGLTAALAYSYSPVSPLVFIALIPLLWVLYSALKLQLSNCRIFCFGFSAGLVYFLFAFHWFLSLHPLDGLGITSGFVSLFSVLAVWFFVSITLASFWGMFGLTVAKLKGRLTNRFVVLQILALPALFVLIEYLSAYAFSLVTSGSGGLLGAHWTFGNFAYALADNSLLLKLASFVGIYGVLFIVILVNVLILELVLLRKLRHVLLVILLAVAVAVAGQVWKRPATGNRSLSFTIIQTDQNYSFDDVSGNNLNAFKKELELLDHVLKDSPESKVIIFPEGSNFFKNLSAFLTPAQIKKYFTELSKDPKLIVDNSRVSLSSKLAYSRILFLNSQQDIVGFYDKKLLTPGGEYLPILVDLLAGLVAPQNTESFKSLFAFSAGEDQKLASFNGTSFRAVACSDLLSPSLFRSQSQDADVIIGLASTAIFHNSRALVQQNLAINKFRAAENSTPLIFAANSGLSYALDNQGNTVKIAPDSRSQLLTGTIAVGAQKSWYNKVGDKPMFLASALILLAAFITSKKLPKK